jgi:putative heme-binding domain-containing protein
VVVWRIAVAALSMCVGPLGVASPLAALRDLDSGAVLFRSDCAGCHGVRGTGGRGPALTRGPFRNTTNAADLFRVIATGIPGSAMPGVIAVRAAPAVWQLVAYVRALRSMSPAMAFGDAAAGQRLFEGRGACLTCHRVAGRGARTGPDLTEIADRRTAAALRAALLTSRTETDPAWWRLRVMDAHGAMHVGRRMDDDTFSVRLLTDEGTLCAFDRATVRSIEHVTTSPMPTYGAILAPMEIDDLVAYLRTFRRS